MSAWTSFRNSVERVSTAPIEIAANGATALVGLTQQAATACQPTQGQQEQLAYGGCNGFMQNPGMQQSAQGVQLMQLMAVLCGTLQMLEAMQQSGGLARAGCGGGPTINNYNINYAPNYNALNCVARADARSLLG